MHYNPLKEKCPLALNPFKACVAPRPIGWISTISRDGICNLAPFSQFQNLSYDPPMVMIAVNQGGDEPDSVHRKDTVNNIESTGCFVYNAVPFSLKDAMNKTAVGYEPEVDEFEAAGLHKAESVQVAAPRVAESPIHFECEYLQTIRIPGTAAGGKGTVDIIIGKVVEIHVSDQFILPDGKLDYAGLNLLCRAGYWDYGVLDETFSMKVPGVSAARMAAMEGRLPNESDAAIDRADATMDNTSAAMDKMDAAIDKTNTAKTDLQ